MGPYTLCDRFTFVAPAGGGGVTFPWIQIDPRMKNYDVWIDMHSLETGTINVTVETSMDTSQAETLNAQAISSTGVTTASTSNSAGALGRLKLESSSAASCVVSVWLLPKQE